LKRSEFLNISLPATGAVLLAPGFFNFQLYREIGWQFAGEPTFDEYDLVINGAGLSGYFASIRAAQKGLRVLVVEKRSSPGFDIAAKRKLWLGADGLEGFDNELTRLFFPEQERFEVQNPNGTGINNSQFGDELALLAGNVKNE
jgi:flavin-dependent dehydrogenase